MSYLDFVGYSAVGPTGQAALTQPSCLRENEPGLALVLLCDPISPRAVVRTFSPASVGAPTEDLRNLVALKLCQTDAVASRSYFDLRDFLKENECDTSVLDPQLSGPKCDSLRERIRGSFPERQVWDLLEGRRVSVAELPSRASVYRERIDAPEDLELDTRFLAANYGRTKESVGARTGMLKWCQEAAEQGWPLVRLQGSSWSGRVLHDVSVRDWMAASVEDASPWCASGVNDSTTNGHLEGLLSIHLRRFFSFGTAEGLKDRLEELAAEFQNGSRESPVAKMRREAS